MKNEEALILEWIAFHALIGFKSFLILDDRSTDRTVEYAKSMNGRLDVRVMPWTEEGPGKQGTGYEKICRKFADEFAWIAFLDSDEFLVPAAGETITTLLERNHAHAAIAVPWRMFGSSGHIGKPAGLVIDRFRYCAPVNFPPNRHVKSIVRPNCVTTCSNPHYFIVEGDYALPNGEPVTWGVGPGILQTFPTSSMWQVNHYFTRSRQHWSERMQRGQLGKIVRTWKEFHDYDRNEILDDRAAMMTPAVINFIDNRAAPPAPEPALAPAPAISATVQPDLIFDIGMSEGDDTEFYLAKGFRVAGVEADVKTYYALCERFAPQIDTGQLTIHNFAAGERAGDIVKFFHHSEHQGLSGLSNARAEFKPGKYSSYHIATIDWAALTAIHGIPYYCKIDIEGQEVAVLNGITQTGTLPVFMSVECHTLPPVEKLYALGYRKFRLIDQNPIGGFCLPPAQREGNHIDWPKFKHSSGPFGHELPDGDWLDFDSFKLTWQAARGDWARTWFDCHAWLP